MKYTVLFFAMICISPTLSGQIDTSSVSLVAYWYKGDVYDYEITKIKESWEQDILEKSDSTTYYATFEVLDSTVTGYTLKWSYQPFDLVSKLGDVPDDLASTLEPIDLIYTTTEEGEIIELTNWKEVSDRSVNLLKKTLDSIDSDNKDYALAIEPIIELYSTKEGIETYAMKEVNVIHFLYGLEYKTGSPITYEDEFPNFFGGDPIRADAELEFVAVDTSDYYFVAEQRSTLNPEDTKAVVTGFLKKISGKKKGKEFKKFLKEAVFEVTDNNVYEYYYYPGIANYIKTQRNTKVEIGEERNRKEESMEIILYFPEEEGSDQ